MEPQLLGKKYDEIPNCWCNNSRNSSLFGPPLCIYTWVKHLSIVVCWKIKSPQCSRRQCAHTFLWPVVAYKDMYTSTHYAKSNCLQYRLIVRYVVNATSKLFPHVLTNKQSLLCIETGCALPKKMLLQDLLFRFDLEMTLKWPWFLNLNRDSKYSHSQVSDYTHNIILA